MAGSRHIDAVFVSKAALEDGAVARARVITDDKRRRAAGGPFAGPRPLPRPTHSDDSSEGQIANRFEGLASDDDDSTPDLRRRLRSDGVAPRGRGRRWKAEVSDASAASEASDASAASEASEASDGDDSDASHGGPSRQFYEETQALVCFEFAEEMASSGPFAVDDVAFARCFYDSVTTVVEANRGNWAWVDYPWFALSTPFLACVGSPLWATFDFAERSRRVRLARLALVATAARRVARPSDPDESWSIRWGDVAAALVADASVDDEATLWNVALRVRRYVLASHHRSMFCDHRLFVVANVGDEEPVPSFDAASRYVWAPRARFRTWASEGGGNLGLAPALRPGLYDGVAYHGLYALQCLAPVRVPRRLGALARGLGHVADAFAAEGIVDAATAALLEDGEFARFGLSLGAGAGPVASIRAAIRASCPAGPAAAAAPGDAPEDLLCPITHELFRDPVFLADGHVYERSAIERWFAAGKRVSPLTNAPVSEALAPAHAVKAMAARHAGAAPAPRPRPRAPANPSPDVRNESAKKTFVQSAPGHVFDADQDA
ncbi:hypothetical protein JL722_12270 [Aureococcus anophagefferens]|nr:hypothetical protein JL722_12270 [Aureococcus anophagefferens]